MRARIVKTVLATLAGAACAEGEGVVGGNRPPALDLPANVVGSEGSPLAFSVTASDPDDDPVAISADDLPRSALFDSGSGLFSWRPGHDTARPQPYTVTFTGDDGHGAAVQKSAQISIIDVNRKPALQIPGPQTVRVGHLLTVPVGATDADSEDAVVISAPGLASEASDATFDGQVLRWTPVDGQEGQHLVHFTAADNHALSTPETASGELSIQVTPGCAPAFHENPTGDCISDTTVTSCGKSGANCAALNPPNSTATCSGSQLTCSFACNPGFHENAGQCDPDVIAGSCLALKRANPGAQSRTYVLDPDGTGPGAPFQAYCEMDLDGGGWTMCYTTNAGVDVASELNAVAGAYGANGYRTRCGDLPFREVLYLRHDNSEWVAAKQSNLTYRFASCTTADGLCQNSIRASWKLVGEADAASLPDGSASVQFCAVAGGYRHGVHMTDQPYPLGFTDCGNWSSYTGPAWRTDSLFGLTGVCWAETALGSCTAKLVSIGIRERTLYGMPDSPTTYCAGGGPPPSDGQSEYGQDCNYELNKPIYVTTAETVLDTTTGLWWQRIPDYNLYSNGEAVAFCAGASFDGYSDWRMPLPTELVSIMDKGRRGPCIDTTAFPGTQYTTLYWSRASETADPKWGVEFNDGYITSLANYPAWVRCVRGQPFSKDYTVDEQNSIVVDNVTGLMWQRATTGARPWSQALAVCEGMTLGPYSDWRLPSFKELMTIIDFTKVGPAIDPSAFPETPSTEYWTSTPYLAAASMAWTVHFASGSSSWRSFIDTVPSVRCVR